MAILKSSTYESDKAKIVGYYKQNGYLDAEILEDKVDYQWTDPNERDSRSIYITIKVKEGERYYFDGYTIAGNKVYTTEQLSSQFELKKNPPAESSFFSSPDEDNDVIFNDTLFQKDRHMISFTYAGFGVYFYACDPQTA